MNLWTKSLRPKYPKVDQQLPRFIMVAVLIAAPQIGAADDGTAQTRLDAMTATEKRELKRKRDQFDRLPDDEQTRLRNLHSTIETHDDAQQLLSVVQQYSDWLKTLSASQRTDLLSLPVDQRLKRIREIKRRSEEDRFGRFTTRKLHPEDAREIFDWLDSVVIAGKQDRLEAMLDDRQRRALKIMTKDPTRRRSMMIRMLFHRNPGILDQPSAAQIEELVTRLSPEAKREFRDQQTDEQKQQLVGRWIQAALASRLPPPPVSPEELQRYFAEDLQPEEREDLERMPRDRMYRELGRMYFRDRMRRGMDRHPGDGGPRWRGDRDRGDRDRGDRDRGDRDRGGRGDRGRGDRRFRGEGRRGEADRDGRHQPGDRRGRGRRSSGDQPLPEAPASPKEASPNDN